MSYLANNLSTRLTGIAVPGLGTAGSDLLRINEVDPNFTMLNTETALLYRLLSMFSKLEASSQPQYWFFEDDTYAIATTVNDADGLTDSDTSLVVDDAIAVAGSVLYVPRTEEIMLVTAATTVTLTVVRGYQGSTAAAIVDADEIVLLGATLEEGGTAKGGIVQLPTKVDNYISFFSQSVNTTDLQDVTNMLNGVGQINGEFAKQTLHIMRQMDQALRFSKGALVANFNSTGKAAYYTKGLGQYLTTAAALPATGMTWYDMNAQFNDAFLPTNSSPMKTLIVSQAGYSKLNKVCFDRWTANPQFEKTIGAMMGQIALDGGGIIDVVVDKYGFHTSGVQGYLLDMDMVGVKPMAGFDLNWREITLPTDHGSNHEVFGSTSLQVKLGADLHRTVTFDA